jgi:hypothetical protein
MMEREEMTTKDCDSNGAEHDEDEVCYITADSPAKARIHVHNLDAIRLGKAALVAALEAGAVLQEERTRRGDEFGEWLDKELGLSRSEAECYIRFYEESAVQTQQLSPPVEVKLPRVLELLGQLNALLPRRDGPVRPTPETGKTDGADRGQSKPKVGSNGDKQSSKPKDATSQPATASERAKEVTTEAPAKTKPVKQNRDDGQLALTPEQEQLVMRRSPKLFMQLRMGNLPPDEALRLAEALPDGHGPQPA